MADLKYEFLPLTFISSATEIRRQVRNTTIFSFLERKFGSVVPLGELLQSTQYGYNTSALKSGKHKFLRISDIKEGQVNWASVPACNCTDEKSYLLQKGDLLVARTGGTTGKSFLIENSPNNAVFAGYLIRLRTNKKIFPPFLDLFLNSYAYWPQIVEMKSGSAQPNVNAEKLKQLRIPNCDIEVQKDIISLIRTGKTESKLLIDLLKRLKEVDDRFSDGAELSTLYLYQLEDIARLRQAILQEAMQGLLVPQSKNDQPASELLKTIKDEKEAMVNAGKLKKEKPLPPITKEEIPFELPKSWVWCRLGDIVLRSEAGKSLVCDPRKASVDEWAIIKLSALSWGKFDEYENKALLTHDVPNLEYKICSGDYLISRANTSELIGRSVVVPAISHKLLLSDKSIRMHFSKYVSTMYVNMYNNSSLTRDYYKSVASGTSDSMKNITREQMYMLPLPLPPSSVQRLIVNRIESLMRYCDELEAEIKTSKESAEKLMQAVLREGFGSGKASTNLTRAKVSL